VYLIVYQLPYAGDTRGRGQLIVNKDAADNDDSNDNEGPAIARSNNRRKPSMTVPCFPLETILAALNRSRVDYFSLDIEGFELPVLKTVDWTRVDIRVLSVEFTRGKVGRFCRVRADIKTLFSRTFRDLQRPGFIRTQKRIFENCKVPSDIQGKVEIWCNLRPQKSKATVMAYNNVCP